MRRDEEVLDEILVLQRLPVEPASAAALLLVRRDRRALDVAGVRDGDDHLLVGDQVLDRELAFVARDLGAALVAVLLGDVAAAPSLRSVMRFGFDARSVAQVLDDARALP